MPVKCSSKKSGLFEQGRLYRYSDIAETLKDEFVRLGGSDDTTKDSVARVMKIGLPRGRYRFLGFDGVIKQSLDVEDRGIISSEASRVGALAPECAIGAGHYEVYAWCLPQYQATCGDQWPIKISKAGPDGLRRRLSDVQLQVIGPARRPVPERRTDCRCRASSRHPGSSPPRA